MTGLLSDGRESRHGHGIEWGEKKKAFMLSNLGMEHGLTTYERAYQTNFLEMYMHAHDDAQKRGSSSSSSSSICWTAILLRS